VVLAAVRGRPLTAEQVAEIAGWPDAEDVLIALEEAGLVESRSPRYGLRLPIPPGVIEASDLEPTIERALSYLPAWARTADPLAVWESTDALLQIAQIAAGRQRWREVAILTRALDLPLASSGRWDAWEAALFHAQAAADTHGDAAELSWALHQRGTRSLALGDRQRARPLLRAAFRLRMDRKDPGARVTRENLALLTKTRRATRVTVQPAEGPALELGAAELIAEPDLTTVELLEEEEEESSSAVAASDEPEQIYLEAEDL